MNEKLKTLLVRTASGAVLAMVIIAAVLASRWTFAALIMVIAGGCVWEFYKLMASARPFRWLGLCGALVLVAGGVQLLMLYVGWRWIELAAAAMLLFPTILLLSVLFSRDRGVNSVGVTLLGVFYVAPLVLWPCIDPSSWGALCFLFVIWASDVFAYLVGMSVGRHKMFERISPKKTWEGFAGGVVGAVGVAVLSAYLLDLEVGLWAGLGIVASLGGVLGDLTESMLKRRAGVKDSGRILPGHGGWLDRFDALLMALPFSFAYLILYSIFTS